MEQIGIITSTNGNKATVRIARGSACGGECGKCSGCEVTEQQIEVLNNIGAKAGQFVKIEIADSHLLTAAFLVYMVPLIMLFAGYLISYSFLANELLSIFSGLIFLVLSYVLIRFLDKRYFNNKKSMITKIIN